MKQIVDYAVLFGGLAIIIATAHYAETHYGFNWWLVATPMTAVAFPLMSVFFKRA